MVMNSDLTGALNRLVALLTGEHPSEDQALLLRKEGIPEVILYSAVNNMINGSVIQDRVLDLMTWDEHYYLKIVLWRVSLTPAQALFPEYDGNKAQASMDFLFWQVIQN